MAIDDEERRRLLDEKLTQIARQKLRGDIADRLDKLHKRKEKKNLQKSLEELKIVFDSPETLIFIIVMGLIVLSLTINWQ